MKKIVKQTLFSIARTADSIIGDWGLHIHSRGLSFEPEDRGRNQDAFRFEGTTHLSILRIIRLVKPKPDDVVFELGCGKGRALCHFARCHVRRVVGIEISKFLSEIAKSNAQSLRRPHAPIEILNMDVATAYLGEGTIFYMFNPFGAKTLKNVLENIERTYNVLKKPLVIIYMNATLSHIFNEFPWLKVFSDYHRLNGQRVLIYRTTNK
jgi:SAM-dependent methyltransferase